MCKYTHTHIYIVLIIIVVLIIIIILMIIVIILSRRKHGENTDLSFPTNFVGYLASYLENKSLTWVILILPICFLIDPIV